MASTGSLGSMASLGSTGSTGSTGLPGLRVAVDALAQLDPGALGDDALASGLLALRREMDRLDAVFARLARAGHVRGVGLVDGAASTAAWLRHRAGMREGDAKGAIAAGAAGEVLTEVGEAWRAGEISSGAARTIAAARVDGHDDLYARTEPEFLRHARMGDLANLRRVCARFRNVALRDGREPVVPDGMTMSTTWDETLVVQAEYHGLAAEVIATAVHAYTDPPSPDDHRTAAERRAAAEVRIHEVALAHAPEGRRPQAQVTVVIDYETVVEGRVGRTDGQFTGPLPMPDIERLLCDCSVSRVLTGPERVPLDVGRSQRTVPPAMRRAIVARDDGCVFPGCDRPAGWTEVHHVVPWIAGGTTARDNLVLLCDHHHTVVHRPGWRLKYDGRAVHVFRPDGIEGRAGPGWGDEWSPRVDSPPCPIP